MRIVIKILRKILRFLQNKKNEFLKWGHTVRINKFLHHIKFVHIMFNDKFNAPFVEFFNSNFPQKDNIFLCKRWFTHKFPEGKNVFEIKTYEGLNFKLENIDKIIIHGLFDGELVSFLYKNKDLLKKTCWSIWGGDLYDAKRTTEDDFVRNNFAYYLPIIDGDGKVVQQKYNSSVRYIRAPVCSNNNAVQDFLSPTIEKKIL